MKRFFRFHAARKMPVARMFVALLLIFTLPLACRLAASAEINTQVVDMPSRDAEHWRITTFSGEMPKDIASALAKDGFSDYSCYSGAMLEQLGNQRYRDPASSLGALALVAIEKGDERILMGMSRSGNEWGLCNLSTKALLPGREFTISVSDSYNASVWYFSIRFTLTYPLADGGSEIYGLFANPGQTGEAPSWNTFHRAWYVNDYSKTDADGNGVAVLNADGAFRVHSLPYDPLSESYYPAYLPCTLEHMDSILDFPTSDADAKRLAEASWARFEGTDLALAWGGVNLRQYPTTASKSLGRLRTGTLVHVLGEEKGWEAPWYHVRVGREEGFISRVYMKFPGEDFFAGGLSTAPMTVAKALDALTLRESPENDAAGTEFPANTLMHVVADVDDDWLFVIVPQEEIGWEMDVNGISGYVRLNEVVQGACKTDNAETTDSAKAADNAEAHATLSVSPTTGTFYSAERGDAYRPVLVEVSNSEQARPAYGLSLADVVFEYIFWGPSFTRYLALYNDEFPETVSSVRSTRTASLSLRNSWDCPIIFLGWEGYTGKNGSFDDDSVTSSERFIARHKIPSSMLVNGARSSVWDIFSRLSGRVSPHNAAVDVQRFAQKYWPENADNTPYEPALPAFCFSDAPSQGSRAATEIIIPYDSQHTARYTYDATDGHYKRWYDGAPQVDALNDQQIIADNVIVLYAELTYPNGEMYYTKWDLTGEGKLDVFIGGRHIEGVWQRADDASPFAYLDQNGDPLLLCPGKTFIQIVPERTKIQTST